MCVIVIDEHQARRLMYVQRSSIDQDVRLMSVLQICISQTDTTRCAFVLQCHNIAQANSACFILD